MHHNGIEALVMTKTIGNLFLFAILIMSCTSRESKKETVIYFRNFNGAIKMYRENQQIVREEDLIKVSYDLIYEDEIMKQTVYIPIKKEKHEYYDSDSTLMIITKLDSSYQKINDTSHMILKYRHDRPNIGIDAGSIGYFTDKYGILREENYNWKSHFILVDDSNNKNSTEIYLLNERIRQFLDPYNPWNEYNKPKKKNISD